MQVVRLEHTQTKDVAKALEETLVSRSPSLDGLKIAVQPGQNALVLSGTTEQIREALELVARLDSRPAR
jgi:type II secretory pathway component GspD/PulD (secretin)